MTTVETNQMRDESIELNLSMIHADDSMNVRQNYDEKEIAALAKSIDEEGLQQALSVWKDGDKYYVCSGYRRRRALMLLASKDKKNPDPKLLCMLKPYKNRDEAMMGNLASDSGVVPISNFDLAARYHYLNSKFKTPINALAKMSARDAATVSKLVGCFTGLTKDVKDAWAESAKLDEEIPLSRLNKWKDETPALQKKALAAYLNGDEPVAAGGGEGDGEGEGEGEGDDKRIDGKKPGKKVIYAELEKIAEKLTQDPDKETAARLQGMSKALRWGLGEITRLY